MDTEKYIESWENLMNEKSQIIRKILSSNIGDIVEIPISYGDKEDKYLNVDDISCCSGSEFFINLGYIDYNFLVELVPNIYGKDSLNNNILKINGKYFLNINIFRYLESPGAKMCTKITSTGTSPNKYDRVLKFEYRNSKGGGYSYSFYYCYITILSYDGEPLGVHAVGYNVNKDGKMTDDPKYSARDTIFF